MRTVHYLNQFFAGIGGEEKAGVPLEERAGAVGPGRLLEQLLAPGSQVITTLVCGDNYAAEHLDEVAARVVEMVRQARGEMFVAGPCFDAGRYGIAAGALCVAVQAELGIPAVTAMAPENPGVDLYRRELYILDSGQNLGQMREVLAAMVQIGFKLAGKEPVGAPAQEHYIPRGLLKPAFLDKTAAHRLSDMLLAKMKGQPFVSEVPVAPFPPVPVPSPVRDLSRATIAVITDGGLVPRGNPDKFPRNGARVWGAYSIAGVDDLAGADYEVSHGGYDNRLVQQDPDRLVPVDVLRELEGQGVVGKLYDEFLSTTGNVAPLENARKVGQAMVKKLKEAGVEAVVLTST